MTPPILPGATIGVLGSGQLGRMLALAARRLGYRVHVFSPERGTPAGQVADLEVSAPYQDEEALARFARAVDVVTVEFENVPAAALELVEEHAPARPGPRVLHLTQDRRREKELLARHGLPHAPFRPVTGPAALGAALAEVGAPAVLKTAGSGYDGKGQLVLEGPEDLTAGERLLAGGPGVLERLVDLRRELSVVLSRNPAGETAHYGVFENRHERHVLDLTTAPAQVEERVAAAATEIALGVLDALGAVGLICVELFEDSGGRLLVNEVAPRPHNSGHLTIEACATSQFEQQLRAVCGLPLGSTRFHSPAAMANLLGDLWAGGEPDWAGALALPGVALHLYGKCEARPGRKMGHLTALAGTAQEAAALVRQARDALGRGARASG